jgi:hypothetical protein
MNNTKAIKPNQLTAIKSNCYVTGYILAIYGWAFFVILVICSVINSDPGDWDITFILTFLFKLDSILLVPGWLLLRFAAGLFPFSRHLFGKENPSP